MEPKPVGRVVDSALYRLDRHVGFNARVEPFWYAFERRRAKMGFFERWREKRRLRRIATAIHRGLGAGDASWETKAGKCVCNLRVARTGLVAELQAFLRENAPEEHADWRHVMAQKDRGSYVLPFEFDAPFAIECGAVTSAPKLVAELAAVNRALKIDETFALSKIRKIDYLDATEKDIAVYESKFGTVEGFWAKFTYVLLTKIAAMSVEHRLPAMFA